MLDLLFHLENPGWLGAVRGRGSQARTQGKRGQKEEEQEEEESRRGRGVVSAAVRGGVRALSLRHVLRDWSLVFSTLSHTHLCHTGGSHFTFASSRVGC